MPTECIHMKKIALITLLVIAASAGTAFAGNSFSDEFENLKGSRVEMLYTEYNRAETGTVVEVYTIMSNVVGFKLQADNSAIVLVPATSIKSIRILPSPKK